MQMKTWQPSILLHHHVHGIVIDIAVYLANKVRSYGLILVHGISIQEHEQPLGVVPNLAYIPIYPGVVRITSTTTSGRIDYIHAPGRGDTDAPGSRSGCAISNAYLRVGEWYKSWTVFQVLVITQNSVSGMRTLTGPEVSTENTGVDKVYRPLGIKEWVSILLCRVGMCRVQRVK